MKFSSCRYAIAETLFDIISKIILQGILDEERLAASEDFEDAVYEHDLEMREQRGLLEEAEATIEVLQGKLEERNVAHQQLQVCSMRSPLQYDAKHPSSSSG